MINDRIFREGYQAGFTDAENEYDASSIGMDMKFLTGQNHKMRVYIKELEEKLETVSKYTTPHDGLVTITLDGIEYADVPDDWAADEELIRYFDYAQLEAKIEDARSAIEAIQNKWIIGDVTQADFDNILREMR